MEELEFILSQRKIIQDKYLKEAKNIWIEFDGEEADKKHKKLYNEYRNKDYFLEGLQAKLIKEMEELEGVEETPLDFEEFESWYEEHQQETERGLRGGM